MINYPHRGQAFLEEMSKTAEGSELGHHLKRIGAFSLGVGAGVGTVGLGHAALRRIPQTQEWYARLPKDKKVRMWTALGTAAGAGVTIAELLRQRRREDEMAQTLMRYQDRAGK